MEFDSSSGLRARKEECSSQNLPGPEDKKFRVIDDKRHHIDLAELCGKIITIVGYFFVTFCILGGIVCSLLGIEIKGSLRSEDLSTCHPGVKMDIDELADRKKLFSFFQKHDTNGDKRLDDKELLLGMLHLYQDTLKKHDESDKLLSGCEFSWMRDYIMNSDPKNGNGLIYYSALQPKEKKNSVSFSSSKKKPRSPKPVKSFKSSKMRSSIK